MRIATRRVQIFGKVFDSLIQEFDLLSEKISNSRPDSEEIQLLMKLQGAITAVDKAWQEAFRTVHFAQEIEEIKKTLEKIPPYVIHKYLHGNNEDSCNLN